MKRTIIRSLGLAVIGLTAAASAYGQANWDFQCIDPNTTNPYSNDYAVTGLLSELMGVAMGVSGTVTYGDAGSPVNDDIPCFTTQQTMETIGRFGFMIGTQGSIQDLPENRTDPTSSFTDDLLALTFGMPNSPASSSSYASTTKGGTGALGSWGTRTRFGSNGINLLFTGESNRYFRCRTTNDNVLTDLTVSVVGDAVQFSWLLTNQEAEAANIGLWFGAGFAMLSNAPDNNGAQQSHFGIATNVPMGAKLGYVVTSTGGRPPVTEHRYRRHINPSGFPQVVDFLFGQTAGFGLRVENGPTPATMNASGQSDATDVGEYVLGQRFFLLGNLTGNGNNFPDVIFPPIDPNDPDLGSDVGYLDNSGFIQKFPEISVAPGSFRRITHYFRSTWGNSNYTPPYAAVVDAPKLISEDNLGGPGSANGLRPNPLSIRVYLDNVGGYATINQEIDLSDVRVTLTLPQGMTLAPGEQAVKFIATVPARQIRFVDYRVVADGIAFGDLPYTVKIEPVPGPTKIIAGTIRVASTPRLPIEADANLLTAPWVFSDTSWETVLFPLQSPQDFQAFVWDPQQQGYVISTSAERGKGVWIVSTADHNSKVLGGNPQRPPDVATGGRVIQLKSGWNMIGNPYNYAIRLGELVGVAAAAPEQSYPWAQLVAQGLVSGSLVYYDTNLQDYVFTIGNDALLEPNRGYWIFVATQQDVTISFPAVFQPFLPESTRVDSRWVQNDKQWRLQFSARTNDSLDAQNFVGQAKNAAEASRLRIMEPPITPVHNVELAIKETVNGQPMRLSQSLSERTGRKEWRLEATTTEAGTVHLTWPNISTVSKKVKFRLTDLATGTTRDLRQVSGYTFEASGPSTREFKIEALPGGISQVVIGNVSVARANGGRSPSEPFTINYTLSNSATTTIRILSGSGKEVFSVARGRADNAGQNSATWALRDNANRLVAPGTYRVEILAETPTGERVRRVVPINVIR